MVIRHVCSFPLSIKYGKKDSLPSGSAHDGSRHRALSQPIRDQICEDGEGTLCERLYHDEKELDRRRRLCPLCFGQYVQRLKESGREGRMIKIIRIYNCMAVF